MRILIVSCLLALFVWPLIVLAQPASLPEAGAELYKAIVDRNVLMAIGAGIFALVEILKTSVLAGVYKKIPKRFRGSVPIILSAAGATIYTVMAGAPPVEAIYNTLFVSGGGLFMHQAVKKMILGK